MHLNKSPMVVGNLKTLTPAMQQRWGIDMDAAMRHAAIARDLPDMSAIWAEVYKRPAEEAPDVDEDLYGGFIGNADRRRLNQLRALGPAELAHARSGFDDGRLEEIFLRYRARNWPESLAPEDAERWEEHRALRLLEGDSGGRNLDHYFARIEALSAGADLRVKGILEALYLYGEAIAPAG